jgi:DNA repair exonuclease SbcCD ATPase subunit
MDYNFETPFDNIESAQKYLTLLSQGLQEATQNAEGDILGEANSQISRRRDALRLVAYKLEKLEQHIKASRRLLNDLRTLRRLLLGERAELVGSEHGTDPMR